MNMPSRGFVVDQHRFGFQNQETDEEFWGGAVSYKYRIHDPRVGRFFSVDPLAPEYPWNSVYAFSENRVVDGVELEGLEYAPVNQGLNLDQIKSPFYSQPARISQTLFNLKIVNEGLETGSPERHINVDFALDNTMESGSEWGGIVVEDINKNNLYSKNVRTGSVSGTRTSFTPDLSIYENEEIRAVFHIHHLSDDDVRIVNEWFGLSHDESEFHSGNDFKWLFGRIYEGVLDGGDVNFVETLHKRYAVVIINTEAAKEFLLTGANIMNEEVDKLINDKNRTDSYGSRINEGILKTFYDWPKKTGLWIFQSGDAERKNYAPMFLDETNKE